MGSEDHQDQNGEYQRISESEKGSMGSYVRKDENRIMGSRRSRKRSTGSQDHRIKTWIIWIIGSSDYNSE